MHTYICLIFSTHMHVYSQRHQACGFICGFFLTFSQKGISALLRIPEIRMKSTSSICFMMSPEIKIPDKNINKSNLTIHKLGSTQ